MKVDSQTKSNLPTLKDAVSRPQQGDAAPANSGAQTASTASQTSSSGSGDASVSLSGLSQHLRSLAACGSADIDTAHANFDKVSEATAKRVVRFWQMAPGSLRAAS